MAPKALERWARTGPGWGVDRQCLRCGAWEGDASESRVLRGCSECGAAVGQRCRL